MSNRKEYDSQGYRCPESYFTDQFLIDLQYLEGVLETSSGSRAQRELAAHLPLFRRAGFGNTIQEVREKVRRHISTCENCKGEYQDSLACRELATG